MAKKNYFTVWRGRKTGVFKGWPECSRQIIGFSGAQFRGFATEAEAVTAFELGYDRFHGFEPEPLDESEGSGGDPPLSAQRGDLGGDLPF